MLNTYAERHGQNPLSQCDGSITPRPSSQWRETNSLRNGTELQEQAAREYDFASPGNRHIMGYTGFIPCIAYKYGQSYDRAADVSMADFSNKQRSYQGHRSRSSSDIEFNKDSIKNTIEQIEIHKQYKLHHPINCNAPPIVGYTGHISHMTDSECSLGRGYHGAAMKAMELVEKETEEIDAKEKEVQDALDEEMENRDALEKSNDDEEERALSMADLSNKQRSYQGHRSRSLSDIEFNKDSMKNTIEQIEIQKQYKVHHPINCNAPPIVGYAGHISHMTDSECSLGRGYHGAAMKALKLVEKETEEIDAKEKEIEDALDEEMKKRDALENSNHDEEEDALDEKEVNGMNSFYGEEEDEETLEKKRKEKEAEIKAALDRVTASNYEYRRGLHTGRRMYNNN